MLCLYPWAGWIRIKRVILLGDIVFHVWIPRGFVGHRLADSALLCFLGAGIGLQMQHGQQLPSITSC